MIALMEECKTTSLYYREGSSDKEYHVRLEAKDDGFVVNIAYGRRGSSLRSPPLSRPRRGPSAACKSWSRAGHAVLVLGCRQTQPTTTNT